MNNNQQVLILPDWVVQGVRWVQHNWTIVVGVFVVAVLASITLEVVKRHYNAKKDVALAKKAVAWLLVVFSTLFSWLAYAIFFAQGHTDWLHALPVVGSHTTEALGVAYTLYALRLSKWYEAFATWATKWTGKKPVAQTVEPVVPEQPVPPATELTL